MYKIIFLLLSCLNVFSYDRNALLECWNIYNPNTEKDKLSLCVRSNHWEQMFLDCAFGDNN
jgi:hypothetical protein